QKLLNTRFVHDLGLPFWLAQVDLEVCEAGRGVDAGDLLRDLEAAGGDFGECGEVGVVLLLKLRGGRVAAASGKPVGGDRRIGVATPRVCGQVADAIAHLEAGVHEVGRSFDGAVDVAGFGG